MCKAHLDAFALVAGLYEGFRPINRRAISGILVNIAWDFACDFPGATARLERTGVVVKLGGAIKKGPTIMHSPAGVQHLVVGAYGGDVSIPHELAPRFGGAFSLPASGQPLLGVFTTLSRLVVPTAE